VAILGKGLIVAVAVLHHDDEGFARWRADHPGGYVVNVYPGGPLVLHRAACSLLRGTGFAQGRSTTQPKACAPDRGELEAWVSARGRPAIRCGICKP
jgi:hypothetical protein